MLALGIDPGTAICGYGLVRSEGSSLKALAYGAIETRAGEPVEKRLNTVFQGVDAVIKQYKPDIVGVEKLFFNRNVTTAMTVSQARGVILLAAAQNGVALAEYTPLEVKQSVAGYGKATKEQIIYMTEKLLHLPAKPHPDDVADALAVAICSLHTYKIGRIWECRR
ncbi:MAG: crossover junction endodeoxyribonuclease RuvC [Sporomusaceae bacterium]|nr:crossover junction endodeoxyribonuclease RuvC [Sporomusaceae bacterium]